MNANLKLPFLFRGLRLVPTTSLIADNNSEFHFDILSFVSIASKLNVDFVKISWQDALESLGQGATSHVAQAQVDALMYLAFKRSTRWDDTTGINTAHIDEERFKALIYELIALEMLSDHPCVVDLLGVTWETDPETEQVWPVLLTERSEFGTMADFLTSEQKFHTDLELLMKLCGDVAQALEAMHLLGIVHGDIKFENILIFREGVIGDVNNANSPKDVSPQRFIAKVIDFGFSCFGLSEGDKVKLPRTRPWQAPEHEMDEYVRIDAARRMDVFSFGMLLCRVFLFDAAFLPLKDGASSGCSGDAQLALDEIDHLKKGPEFLAHARAELNVSKQFPKMIHDMLGQLFNLTLHHDPQKRASSFSQIVEIFTPDFARNRVGVVEKLSIESLSHEVAEFGDILAEIDDDDYILHSVLVKALKKRLRPRQTCPCRAGAIRQLWLCHEIGFGTKRDEQKARFYQQQILDPDFDPVQILSKINEKYEASNPERLYKKLGYETTIQFDPVVLYDVQGRLDKAERAFESEVDGRKRSFGDKSKPYLSLLSLLSTVYAANNKLEKAIEASQKAAETTTLIYGENDLQTIGAKNYLSHILFQGAQWNALEQLLLELIPLKQKHEEIGHEDQTTLNSQNTLMAVYCMQGRYDDCLRMAHDILKIRRERFGPTHLETLTTETWICRASLEKGSLDGLEDRAMRLVQANEQTAGLQHKWTMQSQELLAAILLAVAVPRDSRVDETKLNQALDLVTSVIDQTTADVQDVTSHEIDIDSGIEDYDQIEDVQEEDDSLELEGLSAARASVNLDLNFHLRTTTTLICILAILRDFSNADAEIEDILADLNQVEERAGVEGRRLSEVINLVSRL